MGPHSTHHPTDFGKEPITYMNTATNRPRRRAHFCSNSPLGRCCKQYSYAESTGNGEIDRDFPNYDTAKCVMLKKCHLTLAYICYIPMACYKHFQKNTSFRL